MAQKYGVAVTGDNGQAISGKEVVVLAIKPQSMGEVAPGLRGKLAPGQLVISIIAGARVSTLTEALQHAGVVRVMPNTPAQIGEGISVWTTTNTVTEAQKEQTRTLLACLGREVYVTDEKYIDMATAVSASGPAYVFLIIEALIDGAVHVGMSRDMARELVVQTVLGSALFLRASGRHPAELRNMVTSPGGTTAEGLLQLEEGKLRAVLAQAVIAGYHKAQLLGGSTKQ